MTLRHAQGNSLPCQRLVQPVLDWLAGHNLVQSMKGNGMDRQAVALASAHLRRGGLVVMPTETVYGLAADATNERAVANIFAAKGRPTFDPLIVHVADAEAAWQLAEVNADAQALAAALWPGPLTLVMPRRPGSVPDLVTSGLDTVAVRCPDHPLAQALLRECGLPLAAPSANLFGRMSPTRVEHIGDQFRDFAVQILDGGPCRVGLESTVVALCEVPIVLRPGGVTIEQLSAVLGVRPALADSAGRAQHLPAPAPGMLKSHYAPSKPLSLRLPGAAWPTGSDWGFCAYRGHDLPKDCAGSQVLSASGDDQEAAARLFTCLRALDASNAAQLCAELLPDEGLGLAINDRLRRAAGLG